MRRRSLRTISTLAAVATLATAGVAGASADDQARLDAAVDAFNARMVDAGWVSEGPPSGADDDDDDADDDDDIDDVGEVTDDGELDADDMFSECIGEELAAVFDDDSDEIPGAVASAESDEFSYVGDSGDAPGTTEAFSFDFTEHTVSAVIATIDDENLATVDQFVEVFGREETGECLTDAMAAEMAADEDDSEIPMEFEVAAVTEGDLGFGDRSASVTMTMSIVFMVPIEAEFQFVFVLAGNDLVGVLELVSGEPQTDFDAIAEAQRIVDDLAA